ncbi:MAG: ferritin family protein [bacterium]|nr:ferritin family protein [bacterium]MDT8395557.1 ferritin family protein [bacterium]
MADKREAHVEALQIAMDTEKKGCKFYRIAAKSSSDPQAREVFKHLADDEIEHMGAFATLYESLLNDEPWMTYEEAAARFGDTPPEDIIFLEVPEEAQEGFDDLKALEEALEFEKKAVAFYTERAEAEKEGKARAFYRSLVEIEGAHVQIVQAEIDSLSGSGFWLGYQEISLED